MPPTVRHQTNSNGLVHIIGKNCTIQSSFEYEQLNRSSILQRNK